MRGWQVSEVMSIGEIYVLFIKARLPTGGGKIKGHSTIAIVTRVKSFPT